MHKSSALPAIPTPSPKPHPYAVHFMLSCSFAWASDCTLCSEIFLTNMVPDTIQYTPRPSFKVIGLYAAKYSAILDALACSCGRASSPS